MSSVIPFIIWLFCVGVAALLIGKAIESNFFEPVLPLQTDGKKEGFIYGGNNNSGSGIVLTTCPTGTESYVTESGNTYCCNGDIVDGQCNGNNICSLSPNPPEKGLDTCSGWLVKEWKRRSDRFCTRDLPYYFGQMNRGPGVKEGCSASRTTFDGTQPYIATDPQCKIHDNINDELSDVESCYNIRASEQMMCPQENASREISPSAGPGGKLPALLKCTYIPLNGSSYNVPVHCMDVPRFKTYIGIGIPNNFKDIANNLIEEFSRTDVNFCPASKAYFVDGTLTKANARGLPGSGGPAPAAPVSGPCKFDEATYLKLNPDVKNAGVDAKTHYKQYGIAEGRQICVTGGPCKFDEATYLRLNPDVKKAGVDARTHYRDMGIGEGRQICDTGGS